MRRESSAGEMDSRHPSRGPGVKDVPLNAMEQAVFTGVNKGVRIVGFTAVADEGFEEILADPAKGGEKRVACFKIGGLAAEVEFLLPFPGELLLGDNSPQYSRQGLRRRG